MREGLFLKRNIEKWKSYQAEDVTDPDEMADRFTELVNDLGYSKTFYPHSKVTHYLNGLASKIYLSIYQNKKEESSRIIRFWKTELPRVMFKYRRELLYSFIIFTFFCIMAAFSAAHDETFVRGVLGDQYVDMTEENIAKGDPFGVYKWMGQLDMFFYIAYNNVQVMFMVFVLGFLLSIGTVWKLFQTGVMLGSFEYMFFAKGLGWPSILVIWIHGTLEISAVIIAGAAGMILGNSILFPGTHKRRDSLMRGGKDGIKIMIGLVPVIIAAAFLEAFITRYTSMPLPVSLCILLGSLTFIVWYFVIYPARLEKRSSLKNNAAIS
ncbi:MAG TPA: stage II sporulation protein M [Chitinophagaceae bacterium]|nr:stage II sporulation protein M [Chitinophagaceae bacterium]